MTMSSTDLDSDVLIFLDEGLNDDVQCDWFDSCKNDVQWFVKCGICRQAEVICDEHHAELLEIMHQDRMFTFIFNHTCGHTVLGRLCKIEHM